MKTSLLMMVGVMFSTTIFAQHATRDSHKPESNGYERMKRELNLTDKQYASVKDINSRYSKKRGKSRQNPKRDGLRNAKPCEAFGSNANRRCVKCSRLCKAKSGMSSEQ